MGAFFLSSGKRYNQSVRRLAMFLVIGLLGAAVGSSSCEDDSLYKGGPSTFQNDVFDGGGGGVGTAGAVDAAAP